MYNLELNVTEKIIFEPIYKTNAQKWTFSAKIKYFFHSALLTTAVSGWTPVCQAGHHETISSSDEDRIL